VAVRAFSADPERLLRLIRKSIENGSVETWSIDSDGDLTHTPAQWHGKAWMRPRLSDDRITFNILGNTRIPMTRTVYGVYHGRLVEMLLSYFEDDITQVSATANLVRGDIVTQRSALQRD
jgi:hypothetical protein